MTTCTKCVGSGLIGQGPNPHLREGRTETCDVCKGTGKIPEAASTETNDPAGHKEAVDNTVAPEKPKQGIIGRIFHRG